MNKKNWIIDFDNGSNAHYLNMTSVQAVNCAVNDWYPAKRVIGWQEIQLEQQLERLRRAQK